MRGAQLPEHLGLTHHHAFEPRGYTEDVAQRLAVSPHRNMASHSVHAAGVEVWGQPGRDVIRVVGRARDIELGAIAGGQHHRAAESPVADEIPKQAPGIGLADGSGLEDGERCGAVADTGRNEAHQPAGVRATM